MTLTLDELFANTARRFGRRVAWKAPEGEVTHQEVFRAGARLANRLRAAGLVPGDRVGMMLDDCVEALQLFAGISLAGMVVVPINRDFKPAELDFIIEDSGARALIYTPTARRTVAQSEAAGDLDLKISVGDGDDLVDGFDSYADVIALGSPVPPAAAREPGAPALVAYTSGTTGFPKGAVISHRSVITCCRTSHGVFGMGNYARMVNPGSLQFSAPWWALILPHVYVGGYVRMLGRLTMDAWFDRMEEDRSTYTYVPSPLMSEFTETAKRRPACLEWLQTVLHSSSVAPRDHVEALVEVVGDRFIESYGSTETVGSVLSSTRDDLHGSCGAEDFFASAGRAVPTSEVWLADAENNRLEPGSEEVGEIVVASDTLFSGYWNQPEKTAEVFDGQAFRTGDLGRVDAAGYFYVVGRKTELIISGGANVYPAEVERVLITMEGVADCSVFGVTHERWGETVAAAVVRAPGNDITEPDVVDFVRGRLASYKKPTTVLFLDELPRNASLKVQKHRLREVLTQNEATPAY